MDGAEDARGRTDPPDWLGELPLAPGPPFVAMGLRGIDHADWLVVDGEYAEQLAEKDRPGDRDVFAALPGTEAAGDEVLTLVAAWITEHGPVIARDRLAAARPGSEDGALHPLLRAALLVQEDLCVMSPGDDGYVLSAAAVHFPSHWRLADKIGRPMAAIHGPVRHYADQLATKADRFFERLAKGRIMLRRNVSIHDHDELHRPEPPETYEDFDGDLGALWLRTERQTLRRLDGTASPAEPGPTGDVLFTIKTQQCPLAAVREDPDVAHGLAAKLRAIRADQEASGLPVHAPAALPDWLDAASSPGD